MTATPQNNAKTGQDRAAPRQPVRLLDTSLRDGNQSLWGATGLTTGMVEAVGPLLDQVGYEAIDFTSSTNLSMGVKWHQESPWERISRMKDVMPNTPLSAISTGMRFMSWDKASETVMRMALRLMASHGLGRLQIAEPMNDVESVLRVAEWANDEGITQVVAAVTFTESPVHTDESYSRNARLFSASPFIDSVYLKDPGGLLTIDRTRQLIPGIRAAVGAKSLELHSHCTTGAASQLYLAAAELGVDVLHTGLGPLSNGTAQPSLENLITNLDALGIPVQVNRDAAAEAADILYAIAASQGLKAGVPTEYDLSPHVHQVPGGMMSTLRRQLGELRMLDDLPAVIEEAGRVRADLGYPIMVTPFSQFVGSQALMNVLAIKAGEERYSRIPDEVVRFVLGNFGAPEGEIAPEVLQRVASLPRAKELAQPPVERSLADLHDEYGKKFGRRLSEEELLLRMVLPGDQIDAMLAAGPAPRWSATGATRAATPVTSVTDFIAAAHKLPKWKYLAVRRGAENVELRREPAGGAS
ncbi:biotin carboxyl carrier protein [Cryobacterium frigoriphilum]|uniref:Biotin carboxyl carrier protein n=1 Tax=Cryobacterium frigoriphilum TaxID=1259150 RepID=A0A4R8ZV81_9MICO|nr:biotin carboxyl carrier protein [Cryobacterium frigoriphilum]TFD46946.1 biotin carboxyl carrier protein [Cryobacterium frigoriphilum]